jgi:hypothetical protein
MAAATRDIGRTARLPALRGRAWSFADARAASKPVR